MIRRILSFCAPKCTSRVTPQDSLAPTEVKKRTKAWKDDGKTQIIEVRRKSVQTEASELASAHPFPIMKYHYQALMTTHDSDMVAFHMAHLRSLGVTFKSFADFDSKNPATREF